MWRVNPALAERFVLISGCSGGGKSTLLAELRARGHPCVDEPGRRIVKQEIASGGTSLPWIDPVAFLRRAIEMALADREQVRSNPGWVFFDRGVIDAASALEDFTGEAALREIGLSHRYHRRIFMAPPWPQIYETDAERRHDIEAALPEYDRLRKDFPALGYQLVFLPKASVSVRADFVLTTLGLPPGGAAVGRSEAIGH
jgi:predicted ATPase